MNTGESAALSQIILKVHSRCDLACDYCYVYEGADQSWRSRPRVISDQVISRAAERISEHARAYGLRDVQVILHGGEPLLAGYAKLGRVAAELRSALRGVCGLDLRIHTNGVLLNERLAKLFSELGIKIGVSVDGDQAANDRHRRYANGRSSYDKVVRAIDLLRGDRFKEIYAGLLCTIDVRNDPLAVYDALARLRPPRIDFLLPHATWDEPPARPQDTPHPYADWLIAIYDRWVAAGRPMQIRTFDSIISTLHGGASATEALGLRPVELVVIETDGSYEQVDSLKVAFEGAPETGFDVFRHPLSTVAEHPGIVARQQGLAGLCRECQECPVVTSCGGGLYTHRFRTGTGFANRSVYCDDLLPLITYIRDHQPRDVAQAGRAPAHAMSRHDFLTLATGSLDGQVIAQLADAQLSLRRALLSAVYRAGNDHPAVPDPVRAGLRSGWTTLTRLEREFPGAVDSVLSQAYLRVWAVRCLEWLSRAPSSGQASRSSSGVQAAAGDLAHLGAIGVAAAIRAGAQAAAVLPVIRSAVHLPTLGRFRLGGEGDQGAAIGAAELAAVDVTHGAVVIEARGESWTLPRTRLLASGPERDVPPGGEQQDPWQPVRELGTTGFRIALDDVDPYRDPCEPPVADRLSEAEYNRWKRDFALAWQEIDRVHDEYAPGLSAGLTTLTPLAPATHSAPHGAVSWNAFGAVAATPPDNPVTLALLLIREFQRAKLGAIFDLFDLCRLGDTPRLPGQARGSEGVLASAYTQIAVADFWRVRQKIATTAAAEQAADQLLTESRTRVHEAIEVLAKSTLLTPHGQEFVAAMRRSADL